MFFAMSPRHFPLLRFINTEVMAANVSVSSKRKFLSLDPTKSAETFGFASLTQTHSIEGQLIYSTY